MLLMTLEILKITGRVDGKVKNAKSSLWPESLS